MGWSRRVTAGAIVATLVSASAVVPALSASAASPPVNSNGVIASSVPAKFTPNIVDGAVESIVQVGSRIVVGGSFTQVTPTAGAGSGTTVTRNYIFAFDATTGALDTGFVPAVNGEVDSILPTADGTGVYVGGQFTTAGGISTRLAEFNLTTGARVTTFNPSLNGQISAMAMLGGRLFVAGTFTVVKSVTHDGLTTINPTTGALDPYMSINLTGNHNCGRVAGAACARVGATDMAISPDGTRMIVDGNFINAADAVNPTGYSRDQIVSINPRLDLRDRRPELEDRRLHRRLLLSVLRLLRPQRRVVAGRLVLRRGDHRRIPQQQLHRLRRGQPASTPRRPARRSPRSGSTTPASDSLYSVAITSDAVYVGGHNRWLNNPYGADNAQKGAVAAPGAGRSRPGQRCPAGLEPRA